MKMTAREINEKGSEFFSQYHFERKTDSGVEHITAITNKTYHYNRTLFGVVTPGKSEKMEALFEVTPEV